MPAFDAVAKDAMVGQRTQLGVLYPPHFLFFFFSFLPLLLLPVNDGFSIKLCHSCS